MESIQNGCLYYHFDVVGLSGWLITGWNRDYKSLTCSLLPSYILVNLLFKDHVNFFSLHNVYAHTLTINCIRKDFMIQVLLQTIILLLEVTWILPWDWWTLFGFGLCCFFNEFISNNHLMDMEPTKLLPNCSNGHMKGLEI